MADDTPKRKEYDSANWEVVAHENARAREAAQRRKNLLEALSKYISANGGWVTSVPGAKYIRVEILKNSALPTKLAEIGYVPRLCSTGIRIIDGSFKPVDVIEVTLGK